MRDQCNAGDVPFFFKQWGEWLRLEEARDILGDDDPRLSDGQRRRGGKRPIVAIQGHTFIRVGKKDAGRLLDGQKHSAFPQEAHS